MGRDAALRTVTCFEVSYVAVECTYSHMCFVPEYAGRISLKFGIWRRQLGSLPEEFKCEILGSHSGNCGSFFLLELGVMSSKIYRRFRDIECLHIFT